MMINKFTEDDLVRMKTRGYLTVGKLKDYLQGLPDDGLVFVERVKDMYFDGVDISGFGGCPFTEDGIFPEGSRGDGWKLLLKEGDEFKRAVQFNEAIVDNEYEDDLKPITDLELEQLKTQYSPAFAVIRYNDDSNNLFLKLHH
jgi:hypothetical protein